MTVKAGSEGRIRGVATARARLFLLTLALLPVLFSSSLRAQYTERADAQEDRSRVIPEDYSVDLETQLDPLEIQHYVIDAEIRPATHDIKARAGIHFAARQSLTTVDFEFNANLFPTNITDGEGEPLSSRRMGSGDLIEITLRRPMRNGETGTIVFEYEGPLMDAEHSPVEGVQLAYIGEEGSYLLYPARWFPMVGYRVNRYTAELRLNVPNGYHVVAGAPATSAASESGGTVHTIILDKPDFAGSIAVVNHAPQVVEFEGRRMSIYFSPANQGMAQAYGEAASRMSNFFSSKFGPGARNDLSIVEIDDRSLGGYAATGVIFLSSRAIGTEVNVRLLAQEVAQQWWRGLVSPATKADLWLDHGLATYSEAMYLESLGGTEAIESRIREMAIDALTHDTVPIRAASRTQEFSSAYKSLLYDKAAYTLHMLRWVVGDEKFFQGLQEFAGEFAYKGATTDDFRATMERVSGEKLEGFFLQWMESTGASDFTLDYTVYRVPDGYRISGHISQDKDLFSMPVEVQVETDAEPVTTRVQVTGRQSEFAIATPSRPRSMVVDPNNRVLKYNDTIRVRVAIARGEQAVAERDYTQALEEYQQALDVNRLSSLAHYRIGEVFFALRNYQSAVNAFRESLNGDLEPAWTEVWSHLYMGKIFDVTGQRERAVNEYQQAVRTKDDTQGAVVQAQQYLKEPYVRPSAQQEAGG
jgi:aminopeptidase N